MLHTLKKIPFFQSTLDRYWEIVAKVNQQETIFQELFDAELILKTKEFKLRYKKGEALESLLPEAFALVKNACRRLCGKDVSVLGETFTWEMIPYDVQILGAVALANQTIAQMQTGEGKTLTAAMPLYLYALTEKPVHLVTVNDYLAQRDAHFMATIFQQLGIQVAVLGKDTPFPQRKPLYEADILYTTATELGFDYLRDHCSAYRREDQVQRGLFFALIDEIDSVLIDEAKIPLIISGPENLFEEVYESIQTPFQALLEKQQKLCQESLLQARHLLQIRTEENEKQAIRLLWIIEQGNPKNKGLKKLKEAFDLYDAVEKLNTHLSFAYHAKEKEEALSHLFFTVNAKKKDFEITEKGISVWQAFADKIDQDLFVSMDLNKELLEVEQNASFSEEEKLEKKNLLTNADQAQKLKAHALQQLLRAELLMEKDVDYIVQEKQVVLVDENTGRAQPSRRFTHGLHQAIEMKEHLPLQPNTKSQGTITLQNFFRMYETLSGMTGTADSEAQEFSSVYKLRVLDIPTNQTSRRIDLPDRGFSTEREKYRAILEETKQIHATGRPILIGTESIEISEKISRILKAHKIEHTMLNAKTLAQEAMVIAKAGTKGAITVATNMAGRGTDIKISDEIKEIGGLHVISSTRHHSERVDRQLKGRSGRQGDPGSSRSYVCLEDTLLQRYSSPFEISLLKQKKIPPFSKEWDRAIGQLVKVSQKQAKQSYYQARKNTLDYDQVLHEQRLEIYAFRDELLTLEDPLQKVKELLKQALQHVSAPFLEEFPLNWHPEAYCQKLKEVFPLSFYETLFHTCEFTPKAIEEALLEKILLAFEKKLIRECQTILKTNQVYNEAEKALIGMQTVLIRITLEHLDHCWSDHLIDLENLLSEISLHKLAQKDLLVEYRHSAFHLFERFSKELCLKIAMHLFNFHIVDNTKKPGT